MIESPHFHCLLGFCNLWQWLIELYAIHIILGWKKWHCICRWLKNTSALLWVHKSTIKGRCCTAQGTQCLAVYRSKKSFASGMCHLICHLRNIRPINTCLNLNPRLPGNNIHHSGGSEVLNLHLCCRLYWIIFIELSYILAMLLFFCKSPVIVYSELNSWMY